MVNLTIDDKQVTASKDATIYDAAKEAGIRIPILCHDKKLHPFGGCRMCLVEVEQMKGRLIPACTTPVTEGMIVRTTTDEIIKARKLVLELLLLKHPIDCPVCDAAGDCDLQNLTYEYSVNTNQFTDEKFNWEIDHTNPLIERDLNRCIHCGKCARICDEIVSFGAYSFINRGIEAKVGTAFDGPLDCEFCGSCISVCPVGALNSQPFKFKARWWALNKVKTVCSYCGTGCQLTLGVKDNKVLTTVYDENQGFHNGQLCCRGRFGYQFVNSKKRLSAPLVRKNGSLVEASWDEALTLVASKLKAAGSKTAALVSPRLTNEELISAKKFLAEMVGTSSIGHSAGYAHAALTQGAMESLGQPASPSSIADIQKATNLFVIKSDAYETHPVIGFEINLGVKRKEIALTIISDKKGKLSKLPKAETVVHAPGAEIVLLNAMAAAILEENLQDSSAAGTQGFEALKSSLAAYAPAAVAAACGMTAEQISELARAYAKAEKPLFILPLGQGYPGHGKELAQALVNLAALTGKIGKEGSGLLILAEKNNSQGAADLGISTGTDVISGCLSGACTTLYIIGENPVVSYPDRKKVEKAIDQAEFVVVQDLFLTETAAKADVVLPACSFAEKEGTFTSAGRAVQKVAKAIKPLGDSKSDFDIIAALAKAMGERAPYATPAEAFAAITSSVKSYEGLEYSAITSEGVVLPGPVTAKFVAVAAQVPAAEAGKFALLTGSALHHNGTMSLYGEGPMAVSPAGYVELSREDAAALGVTEEDTVKVSSAAGEVRLNVKVGTRVAKGTVFAPYHFAEGSINTIATGSAVTWVTISK